MLVSQSEFARMRDVSEAAVSKWKKRGWLVLQGSAVDVDESDKLIRKYRDSSDERATRGKSRLRKTLTNGLNQGLVKAEPVKAVKASGPVLMTVEEIRARLDELDWTREFDWEADDRRAILAARCVGMEAVTSDRDDDGHWGGFQLRDPRLIEQNGGLFVEAIEAGFGFELTPDEVIAACRECVTSEEYFHGEPETQVSVIPDLLPLLAYPHCDGQEP